MAIDKISDNFTAFFHPQLGANVGLIRAPEGTVLIDTTSSPAEITALLAEVKVQPEEVRLVINTHFHSDHTWGNQVFRGPILAHRLCLDRMLSNLRGEWSPEGFEAYIQELEKTNQEKAMEFRQAISGLQIKVPDQSFEQSYTGEVGGKMYEVIHMGGHTPDTSIVWMPDIGLLYASDLIFQGRYPYVFDADIPGWIDALDRLLKFDAEVVIPGHGVRVGAAEIKVLQQYLENTWNLAKEHILMGHSVEETMADAAFPVFPGEKYERLHRENIRYMYLQQTRR